MTEMNWYSRLVYVLVSIALVLGFSLVPATTGMVAAQGGDTAGGKFTIGLPVVTVTYTPISSDPTANVSATVSVDNAGRPLSNLTDIVFKFWYNATGGAASQDDFDAAAADVHDCLIINWTGAGGFALVGPTSTTWALDGANCSAPADLGETIGDFVFVFKIGKVARETTGSAIWQIAANATDPEGGFGWDADGEGTAMTFYNEVSIPEATTVDWGTVPPGLDFEDTASEQPLNATVTYIANGDYNQTVSSDNWDGDVGGEGAATLDETGACSSNNSFALKANINGTLPDGGLVTKAGTTIASGTITEESGNVESANTLWLKLAATFESDVYTGTITYSALSAA